MDKEKDAEVGDYLHGIQRVIVEADEEDPKIIAAFYPDEIQVIGGYRIRMKTTKN